MIHIYMDFVFHTDNRPFYSKHMFYRPHPKGRDIPSLLQILCYLLEKIDEDNDKRNYRVNRK